MLKGAGKICNVFKMLGKKCLKRHPLSTSHKQNIHSCERMERKAKALIKLPAHNAEEMAVS